MRNCIPFTKAESRIALPELPRKSCPHGSCPSKYLDFFINHVYSDSLYFILTFVAKLEVSYANMIQGYGYQWFFQSASKSESP